MSAVPSLTGSSDSGPATESCGAFDASSPALQVDRDFDASFDASSRGLVVDAGSGVPSPGLVGVFDPAGLGGWWCPHSTYRASASGSGKLSKRAPEASVT